LERILNDNDKIRKAEDIYYRRNNRNINIETKAETKNKTYLGSKILLQFIILVNITIVIFAIQNKNYIFTSEFLENLERYNMNISSKINGILKPFQSSNSIENENEQIYNDENSEINKNDDIVDNEIIVNEDIEQNDNGISSSFSQMDLDIENLKESYEFIKPVDGVKSSAFGSRGSKYQNIAGFHTGVDLAAEKGTKIKSAFTGTVTLVSSKGDYRETYENKL